VPGGTKLRLVIDGPDFDNPDQNYQSTVMVHPTGDAGAMDRLKTVGLSFINRSWGSWMNRFLAWHFSNPFRSLIFMVIF
jgi:hypothetical protein